MQQSKSKPKNANKPKKSSVRIIGGSLKGRKVSFTEFKGLRPTLDRVRETLFNWLVADIHDANCLDLYAGSGALGIEAISRGANSVILVDANRKVSDNLKENLQQLSIKNAKAINKKAEDFLTQNKNKFDLVFLDPPFEKGMLNSILELIKKHLANDALVYIEQENTGSKIVLGEEWNIIKSKETSRFCYSLLSLK